MKIFFALISLCAVCTGFSQTQLTQSSNQVIWINSSAACTTSGPGTIHNNSFLRVYDTDDFNVQDTVFFIYVEIGVESTTGSPYQVYGRVHELNGTLLFSNMSLIAADTVDILPDSTQYKLFIPMKDGYALPGDTLVVEVFTPLNGAVTFYPGSNPYVESGGSYIAAAGCGMAQPTLYSDIGFPAVHLVLNLWVNHKPNLNTISLGVFKDNTLNFTKNDFDVAMNDYDNDSIVMLKIVNLPSNGAFEKGGATVVVGDTIYSNELAQLTYTPTASFSGTDEFYVRVHDNNHWSNDSTLIDITVFDWQVGITQNEKQDFQIYPNPTDGLLQIKSAEKFTAVKIYSTNGRLVKTILGGENELDIKDLASGTYILQLITASGNHQLQFIKN